jgi:cytochrome P450
MTDSSASPDTSAFPRNIQQCPYPWYRELRKDSPVHKIDGREDYFVARWADIAFITSHSELFSNVLVNDGRFEPPPEDDRFGYRPTSMASSDPPEHRAKRLAGLKLFTGAKLNEYAPNIERVTDELIDSFIADGEAEFHSQFAEWLPVRVIADVLGFPQEDIPDLKRWSNRAGQGSRYLSDDELAEERARTAGVIPYLERAVMERAERPGDDGLSLLVQHQVARDGALNLPYLVAESNSLLFAGNATTTHMLASTMLLALQNPEALARAQADHALIGPLVEESLRLESPVQFTQRRCVEDVELGSKSMAAGSVMLCGWASGNRDDRRWQEAEALDLDRIDGAKHQLAFGRGPHRCLGAPLARLEGTIAFRKLFSRLANLRLAEGANAPTHIEHPHLRAPTAVNIRFDPALR